MKVMIDVQPGDALIFARLLNEDGGFRELATHRLLQQNKNAGIEPWTAFVTVLGRISQGFTEAIEQEKVYSLEDHRRRRQEIRELARIAA